MSALGGVQLAREALAALRCRRACSMLAGAAWWPPTCPVSASVGGHPMAGHCGFAQRDSRSASSQECISIFVRDV